MKIGLGLYRYMVSREYYDFAAGWLHPHCDPFSGLLPAEFNQSSQQSANTRKIPALGRGPRSRYIVECERAIKDT
jgi:hypothetical protein